MYLGQDGWVDPRRQPLVGAVGDQVGLLLFGERRHERTVAARPAALVGACWDDDGIMRIDLHAHTTCSDGTLTPEALVYAAAAAGLDVVAITDHDTTLGWRDAWRVADAAGIRVVLGIELSTRNQCKGQHLLAYYPDATDPALVAMLARGEESRLGRVPAMLAKFRDHGIHLTEESVARFAGGGSVGRPHIADALIAAGYCATRDEAFARYLRPECPTYVSRYEPEIEDAIAVVRAAGGVPVVAHPWGRKGHINEERFADLSRLGLAGIEVDHQEHDEAARDALRGIARNLGLIVTGSSDFHGDRKINHDLGCNTTEPDEFDRILELSAAGTSALA